MADAVGKVLVTGGAGFIGSHLVDRLLEAGHEVTAVDNLSTGKLENIKHNFHRKDFHFTNCDVRNHECVKGLVEDVDVIFHEAAVTKRVLKPTLIESINVKGTLNLLEAAVDSNVKRFIFASSAAVYGHQPMRQREDMQPKPISPYGVSKLAAENYIRIFHETYGLQTVCLRYFNVYGPRQTTESPYSGVIAKFILRLLDHRPLTIYGDGKQSKDFVHVDDIVDANTLALENPSADDEFFNIGTGRSTSVNDLAAMLLKSVRGNCGKILHSKAKPGDIRNSCANITKAQKIIGFKPKRTLGNELPRLITWYKKNRSL